jgi:hypothetical protein
MTTLYNFISMKRYLFFGFYLLFSLPVHSQHKNTTTASLYHFRLTGKITSPLPGIVDSTFSIYGKVRTEVDSRFCLLLFEDADIAPVKGVPTSGNQDQDSILFDLQNKIAYNLNENFVFTFSTRTYEPVNKSGDTFEIRKADTLILLSKNQPGNIYPVPTLAGLPYAVIQYETSRYSFRLLSSGPGQTDLQKLYNRCRTIKTTKPAFRFMF